MRIVEDGHYPSSRPPPNASDSAKKERIIIIAVRKSGRVRVHKARENPNGTFQIGKTWNLDELTAIENDPGQQTGFIAHLGKPYYWTTSSVKEKTVFVGSLVKIYKKYTGGKAPELMGLDTSGHITKDQPTHQHQHQQQHQHGYRHHQQQSPVQNNNEDSNTTPRQVSDANPSRPHYSPVSSPRHASSANDRIPSASSSPQHQPPVPKYADSPHSASASSSHTNLNDHHSGTIQPSPLGTSEQSLSAKKRRSSTPMEPVAGMENDNNNSATTTRSRAQTHTASHQTQRSSSQFGVDGNLANAIDTEIAALTNDNQFSNETNNNAEPMASSSPIEGPPISAPTESSNSLPRYAETGDSAAFAKGHRKNRSSVHDVKMFARVSHDRQASNDSNGNHNNNNNNSPQSGPILTVDAPYDDDNDDDDEEIKDRSVGIDNNHNNHSVAFSEQPRSNSYDRDEQLSSHLNQRLGDKELSDNYGDYDDQNEEEEDMGRSSRSLNNRLSFNASAAASALAVEETLGELNWTGRDDFKTLEANITKELTNIEATNLHNVVDLDDRLDELDNSLKAAIAESEKLDTMLAFFSVQLGSFSDDIAHIEGQGQGLQVQTTNQKLLWNELHRILQTVSLPDDLLHSLQNGRLDTIKDLSVTESALVELYGALKMTEESGSDSLGNMRALREKRHIYEQAQREFTTKFKSFVDQRFQSAMQESEKNADSMAEPSETSEPQLIQIEPTFMKSVYPLSGIILFLKEVDQMSYGSTLKTYEYLIKPYYQGAVSSYLAKWRRNISALLAKIEAFAFTGKDTSSSENSNSGGIAKSLKRTGTLARLRSDSRTELSKSSGNSPGSSPTGLNGNGNSNNSNGGSDSGGWNPDSRIRGQIKRSLNNVVFSICSVLTCQQEVLILLFHQSSFSAQSFPDYVKKLPVAKRNSGKNNSDYFNIRDIDADRSQARELQNVMGSIFGNVQEDMGKFIEFLGKNSSLDLPYLVASFDAKVNNLQTTNQDFLVYLLTRLRDRASSIWQQFIQSQIKTISNTLVSSKKRRGVIYFVKQLPAFCKVIEGDLAETSVNDGVSINELPARQMVDGSYDQIFRTVFHNLQRIAKEPSTSNNNDPSNNNGGIHSSTGATANEYEDKEMLNYHIMMIENMNVLKEGLASIENNAILNSHRDSAMSTYKTELDNYIEMVIRRPLGKIIEFIEGVDLLVSKNPNESPTLRHGYGRYSLKRLLSGFDAKELRKGVDVLYKRAEKHFLGEEDRTDKNPQLFHKVWSALQAQYSAYYSRLYEIADKYYADVNGEPGTALIEFTKSDITSAFNK